MSLHRLNFLLCATCPSSYRSTTRLQRFLSATAPPVETTKQTVHSNKKKLKCQLNKKFDTSCLVFGKPVDATREPTVTEDSFLETSSKENVTADERSIETPQASNAADKLFIETPKPSNEKNVTANEWSIETLLASDVENATLDERRRITFSTNVPPKPLTIERSRELSKQMLTVYWGLLPSEEDAKRVNTFVSRVRECLQVRRGKRVDVQVFGSVASGLWMGSNSDVDLTMIIHNKKDFNVYDVARDLDRGRYSEVKPIAKASVPIVKFSDPRTKISSDINIMNECGIKNTDMIREYCNFDERIKPFLYLVKWFVKRRNLNNPSTDGTPSSYCHVMMALHYLQVRYPPIIPSFQKIAEMKGESDLVQLSHGEHRMAVKRGYKDFDVWSDCAFSADLDYMEKLGFKPDTDATLADLLHGYFMYYGYDFQYKDEAVSLRLGRRATKAELGFKNAPMVVEDPFLLWKNLLGSADFTVFQKVQKAFREAAHLLQEGTPADALEQLMARKKPQRKGNKKRA